MLENLQKCVEDSRLSELPSFHRNKEQRALLEEERQKLKQNPSYSLSNFLQSKSFFYITRLEYSAHHRSLIIELIDDPDIQIEKAKKATFTFSKILYFSDEWNGEDDELEELENIELAKFVDSPIFFDAYAKKDFIEYFLILSYCEICFRTSEMPEIR